MALWVLLNSCSHSGGVTSVDPCIEIPFVDGAEGACVNTVSHSSYIVNSEDWLKMRPTMIMVRASDWEKIKLDWMKGCRMLISNGDECNVRLQSIDQAVQQLNQISETVISHLK